MAAAQAISTVGARALIVDLPDLTTVMDWHAHLTSAPLPGQVEAIAAARTVLLRFSDARAARAAVPALREFSPAAAECTESREVRIEVVYDGEDLIPLAEQLQMSPEALVEWHTQTTWVGAFGGFAPGFTYCVPEDSARALEVPRLSSPRTAVPAGAVGLADNFSAIYPRTSPGGWQLIGRSPEPMWDATQTPPARVLPNTRVRYEAVREAIEVPPPAPAAPPSVPSRAVLEVTDAGLQSLYQDAGRPGRADLGVTASGAADQRAARAANRAVGNEPDCGVIENIGGIELRALADAVVAVTSSLTTVRVGQRPVPTNTPVLVPAGTTLKVAEPKQGLRTYIAVRGGCIAPTELGSCSTDVLSGLGPKPLTPGERVRIPVTVRGSVGQTQPTPEYSHTLRVIPGPRDEWFDGEVQALTVRAWIVTPSANRVGVRLSPADETRGPIERAQDFAQAELPSEGMVPGAIQVPPNGQPVVFLRDHPVTGGYPVIAVVCEEDLDAAAQLASGDTVRFEVKGDL